MKKHHVDILISEADVRSRITELGAEITHFYQQKAIDKLIVVGLLRGSFMFMADLVRELKLPVEVEFMTTSSYGSGMTSNHDVKITKDLEGDIRNEHVLIVEDIIDTEKDSLRFYYLGNKYQTKIEHIGVDRGIAPDQTLIL